MRKTEYLTPNKNIDHLSYFDGFCIISWGAKIPVTHEALGGFEAFFPLRNGEKLAETLGSILNFLR